MVIEDFIVGYYHVLGWLFSLSNRSFVVYLFLGTSLITTKNNYIPFNGDIWLKYETYLTVTYHMVL